MRMVIGILVLASAACSAHDGPVASAGVAIVPQDITFADIERHDLFGAGCYFLDNAGRSGDEKAPMLFLASDEKGWLKLDGQMVEFVADQTSSELPYLSRSKYRSKELNVALDRNNAKARSTGPETETAPGSITIRDEGDRVVFQRSGAIDCGA